MQQHLRAAQWQLGSGAAGSSGHWCAPAAQQASASGAQQAHSSGAAAAEGRGQSVAACGEQHCSTQHSSISKQQGGRVERVASIWGERRAAQQYCVYAHWGAQLCAQVCHCRRRERWGKLVMAAAALCGMRSAARGRSSWSRSLREPLKAGEAEQTRARWGARCQCTGVQLAVSGAWEPAHSEAAAGSSPTVSGRTGMASPP